MCLQNENASQLTTLTRLTSHDPLTKTIWLENGILEKEHATPMIKGTAERVSFETMSQLAEIIMKLEKNEGLIHGEFKCDSDKVRIVRKADLNGQPNTIARTLEYFDFPKSSGTFLFDHDTQPGLKSLDRNGFMLVLTKIFSAIEGCG